MSHPVSLPIQPVVRPPDGAAVVIPGSKSITNRALLLAALCGEPVILRNALFSDDTRLMAGALRALGFTVGEDAAARTLAVSGQAAAFRAGGVVRLDAGLAGTAARFLTALCAAAPRGEYVIDGTEKMRTRPMRGLVEALRGLGADITCPGAEGFLPLRVRARGLDGGDVAINASESSQLLSALLMVAPLARGRVRITTTAPVRAPFVGMTLRMMRRFGQDVPEPAAASDDSMFGEPAPAAPAFFEIAPAPYRFPVGDYAVEPDATSASYFFALPLVTGGSLRFPGFPSEDETLQGDLRFLRLLRHIGLKAEFSGGGLSVGAPRTLVQINRSRAYSQKRPFIDSDFSGYSDTFLTLAALTPLLGGIVRIGGIAHTRLQETDRVAGAAAELRQLGQHVVESGGALEIHPRPLPDAATVATHGDHRFAMAFAILGTHDRRGDGRPWLTLKNPSVCAKTFPDFFNILGGLM
ncbi:MAG: hypothetical protein LBR12_02245 [Opitutaceae bacterium]|jgi:3-phosphoshikimate 1-carboxyvinyltransferase|nr:hypothetical protein [Opitutaceae bacterium]